MVFGPWSDGGLSAVKAEIRAGRKGIIRTLTHSMWEKPAHLQQYWNLLP